MIEPCMVSSWLYCSGERNCRPGRASSARMSSAMKPPAKKYRKLVNKYITPIVLWSVLLNRSSSREPLRGTGTGLGRLTIGCGAIRVIFGPPRATSTQLRMGTHRGEPADSASASGHGCFHPTPARGVRRSAELPMSPDPVGDPERNWLILRNAAAAEGGVPEGGA